MKKILVSNFILLGVLLCIAAVSHRGTIVPPGPTGTAIAPSSITTGAITNQGFLLPPMISGMTNFPHATNYFEFIFAQPFVVNGVMTTNYNAFFTRGLTPPVATSPQPAVFCYYTNRVAWTNPATIAAGTILNVLVVGLNQ